MKLQSICWVLVALALSSNAVASGKGTKSSAGVVQVSGHTTKTGTYVAPHYRTTPDQTKLNNWSSKPNVNPYTGKVGTRDPYAPGH